MEHGNQVGGTGLASIRSKGQPAEAYGGQTRYTRLHSREALRAAHLDDPGVHG